MTPRVKASVLNSNTRAFRQVVVFEVRQQPKRIADIAHVAPPLLLSVH